MLLTYRKYVLKLADRYGIDHEAALRMAEAKRQGKELLVVPMIPETHVSNVTVWDGTFKPITPADCKFKVYSIIEADEPTIITKPSAAS